MVQWLSFATLLMRLPMVRAILLFMCFSTAPAQPCEWFLPIRAEDRRSWEAVRLSGIGEFGLPRRARPQVPAHLHTGVDILRPGENYRDEPVFPAAEGIVISLRSDGPFAQVIVEHRCPGENTVWTVYEHLAGLAVTAGDTVSPLRPLGRFMTREELNRFGWQFDHLHFEILREKPRPLAPAPKTPLRLFTPYSLECFSAEDLHKYYFDPREFLASRWKRLE